MFADVIEPTHTEKTEKLIRSHCSQSKKSIIKKLSVQENEVRKYILTEYTRLGTAPTIEKVKERFQNADSILQKLDELDFIYLDREKTTIECSYPFSTRETIHQLEMDGIQLYCMCAVDALGVPFMIDKDVTIYSKCGFTGDPLTIRIENKKIISRTHRNIWVWASLGRCGKSADSSCKKILFFTSDHSLDKWLEIHPEEKGERLTLPEAFLISKYIFENYIK